MKLFRIFLLVFVIAGCSTTPRDAGIRADAIQVFGGDSHLKIHEVISAGPISDALSGMSTSEELSLASDMQAGASQDLDLVVWSYSSSKAASVLLRAMRYPNVRSLPHLRLMFVGDASDAESVRSAVEATGAKFYFHQR